MPYVTGFTTKPIVVMPAATRPTVRTGRHRGDGKPSGREQEQQEPERRDRGSERPLGEARRRARAPGKMPGRQAIPATLYAEPRLNTTSPSATPCRTHPIGFRARRTISAPNVA